MSNELISLLVLVAIFVVGTTMPVNMGVLGIVAAFAVGTAMGVSEDDIFLGFPGDLFIILVGVTYLFGIASSNGTVNWLVHASVRAVGISSSVVDSSPFSTSGALTVANTPEQKRDYVFKRLMQWGMSMVVIAPPIAWLVFVVPGWL